MNGIIGEICLDLVLVAGLAALLAWGCKSILKRRDELGGRTFWDRRRVPDEPDGYGSPVVLGQTTSLRKIKKAPGEAD